jgi:hypothetical protein
MDWHVTDPPSTRLFTGSFIVEALMYGEKPTKKVHAAHKEIL